MTKLETVLKDLDKIKSFRKQADKIEAIQKSSDLTKEFLSMHFDEKYDFGITSLECDFVLGGTNDSTIIHALKTNDSHWLLSNAIHFSAAQAFVVEALLNGFSHFRIGVKANYYVEAFPKVYHENSSTF